MSRFSKLFKPLIRGSARTIMALAVLLAGGVVLTLSTDRIEEKVANADVDSAWGNEALVDVASELATISPVSLANACGLGASSCFKCHNGKRAKAADMNEATAPWHSQHSSVNNSCTGCHGGNPRLMKEKMAHRKMIENVLGDANQACSTCHADNDVQTLAQKYTSLRGN